MIEVMGTSIETSMIYFLLTNILIRMDIWGFSIDWEKIIPIIQCLLYFT